MARIVTGLVVMNGGFGGHAPDWMTIALVFSTKSILADRGKHSQENVRARLFLLSEKAKKPGAQSPKPTEPTEPTKPAARVSTEIPLPNPRNPAYVLFMGALDLL